MRNRREEGSVLSASSSWRAGAAREHVLRKAARVKVGSFMVSALMDGSKYGFEGKSGGYMLIRGSDKVKKR